jgi:vacuolar fusion protein MON1
MEHAKTFSKKKQFFVFTSAGKPVWTRYGDETDLTTFIGSVTAILYNFQQYYRGEQDSLRYIRTKDVVIVFLCTQALYYVCVCKKQETIESIYQQLDMLHSKVISTLTNNITTMLMNRPNYDARNLMGGTHASLDSMIKTTSRGFYFLKGFMPTKMAFAQRMQIGSIFKNNIHPDVVYGFLMTTNYIIYRYCRKNITLHHIDLSLLANLVTSYTSLRSTMSWTPICLPHFSDEGFLYAWITFIQDSDICIALLSDNAAAFKDLKSCGNLIETEMQGLKPILEESVALIPFSVSNFEVKEINHFVYFSGSYGQYIMTGTHPACGEHLQEIPKEHYLMLLKRYSIAYGLSEVQEYYKGNFTRVDVYRNEQIVCLRNQDYLLLASMSSLVSVSSCVQACSQLLKTLRLEEPNLFIPK